jgi:hypothetical protein
MKTLLYLLLAVLAYGCAAGSPKSTELRHESAELRHESAEKALLTEEKFMARVSKSADMIYEGMHAINDAAKLYAVDNNGSLPPGLRKAVRALLLDGGYLKEWPVVPAFAFAKPVQYDFTYHNSFDDMDGLGPEDDVLHVPQLKNEVCEEFIRRYSSPGFGDMIYDFEAAGKKYPGEALGRHIKIYAINWTMATTPDSCDILWVVKYNVPPPPRPGRK